MKTLVIGGSGLMGAPTVRRLLAAGHSVTVLSRGTARGSGIGGRRPPLPPGVPILVLDRGTADGATGLAKALASERFEAVVDFFAIEPAHCQTVIDAYVASSATPSPTPPALKHYVFISTNMVYPGGPGGWDVSGLRPTIGEGEADLSAAAAAAAPDDYGGRKLKAESALAEAWKSHRFPYTTLRPPSVIGPGCDDRHERLQRIAMGLPALPAKKGGRKRAVIPTTFRVAFSEDVAQAVEKALAVGEPAMNKAFNIAMAEEVTVTEYLQAVRASVAAMGFPVAPLDAIEAELAEVGAEVTNYENQSAVDIELATQVLGFTPTPFAEFIKTTTDWHTPLVGIA